MLPSDALARAAARLIPADAHGRIDPAELAATIARDRASGAVPVMVVATAGTTNAGAIDDLAALGRIADESRAWFHVDAAWGGALLTSDRLRPLLAGIDSADSITIDAHKWLATTMGCGMILVARPAILTQSFDVRTSFMPSHAPTADPYLTTLQWSRRFMGLRLFLALGPRSDLRPAPEGPAPVRAVVARVLEDGQAWLSAASFAGQDVVRACITHGRTSEADIDLVIDILQRARP